MDTIEPDLIKRACGGWLAVTPEGSPLRLGVEGKDKAAATEAYREERERWTEILARVDQPSVSGR